MTDNQDSVTAGAVQPPTDRPLTAGDYWIDWQGGENPVPDQVVAVQFRNGRHDKAYLSDDWGAAWQDNNSPYDIIAYRIARPATSAASEGGKFRKKPVVIDAFEMRAEIYGDRSAWPQWLEDAWNLERGAEGSIQNYGVSPLRDGPLQVVTLEGLHNVQVGDWIIRGVKGELYPCKPDVFALTYEPAALASPPVSERERELEGVVRAFKKAADPVAIAINRAVNAGPSSAVRLTQAEAMAVIAATRRALTAQPAGEGK